MTVSPNTRKRELLSSVWLFKELQPALIDQLVRYVRTELFRPNDVIVAKGDPGLSMMVVVEGRVKIRSIFWDGREIVFNIIDRGEVFGEIALLDGRVRTADAIAMAPTELLVLERRDLLPLMRRDAEIGIRLLSVLCDRIRRTSEQVEDLLFLGHPVRLAKILLWLATRYGRPTGDGIALEITLSQRELGTLVGVRREAMNRQLAAWRSEKLIEVKEGAITILDVEAFERMVEALEE